MHALSHPFLEHPLPTCESILLDATPLPKVWEAKTRDICVKFFPRRRVLVCLKPFQFMFARDISIISSFWPGKDQDHNYDLQFFHNLRWVWWEKAITFSSQRDTSHHSVGVQQILLLSCGYSWVLRFLNSCETDDSGLVQGACKPASDISAYLDNITSSNLVFWGGNKYAWLSADIQLNAKTEIVLTYNPLGYSD